LIDQDFPLKALKTLGIPRYLALPAVTANFLAFPSALVHVWYTPTP
jgi:hypothetical protein